MNVFESLTEKKVSYNLEAPWNDKNYSDYLDLKNYKDWEKEPISTENDDQEVSSQANDDLWGKGKKRGSIVQAESHLPASKEDHDKNVFMKLKVLSFVSALSNTLSCLLFILPFAFIFGVKFDFIQEDPLFKYFGIHFTPRIFLVGLLILIVLVAIMSSFAMKLIPYRNRLYKKTIVHQSLDLFFDVDYVESDDDSDPKYETLLSCKVNHEYIDTIVKMLRIRDGNWQRFEYNDLFMVEYDGKPILFIDMSLSNIVKEGKYYNQYHQFMGQLMIIPTRTPCRYREEYPEGVLPHDLSQYPEKKNERPPLLETTCYSWLRKGNDTANKMIQELFKGCSLPEKQEAPLSLDEWGGKYYNIFKSLRSVSKCDYGVVVTESFMVLILENNFDPFEFGFMDIFKTVKAKSKTVKRQSAWVCRVVKALCEGGVI